MKLRLQRELEKSGYTFIRREELERLRELERRLEYFFKTMRGQALNNEKKPFRADV
ncbi:hypothetical protein [Staphylospora marina]|uniref:hypothetical protein n=1 Tax=Staphylospora marina TaxID=2490858 RepID=UPI0013DDFC79|nr:hypothetical protein [Staphylospora marina]